MPPAAGAEGEGAAVVTPPRGEAGAGAGWPNLKSGNVACKKAASVGVSAASPKLVRIRFSDTLPLASVFATSARVTLPVTPRVTLTVTGAPCASVAE